MNPFGLLAAVFVWLAFFALLAAFFTRMKPYAHKVRVPLPEWLRQRCTSLCCL